MGPLQIGVNLEFVRSADKPFAAGVQEAARIGYEYVEPLVHTGRELLSEAGYYHSFSMEEDPLLMKEILDENGVTASGLSSHTPLMRPDISVNYLRGAIRFAADIGAPVVNTDEGPKPDWMSDEEAFAMMKYTLTLVMQTAERYGIYVAIEPHQIYTCKTEGLVQVSTLVNSPFLKINYDTGNAFLAGEDPYEGLETVKERVVHLHAKDISVQHAEDERGKVTGTPVGCACGEGVIDWERIIRILDSAGFDGVYSVECGTVKQAETSLKFLKQAAGRARGTESLH